MKIPKTLSIGGHSIKVEVTDRNIRLNGEGEVWGWYDDDKHVMCLRKGMAETRQLEVILHESLHSISAIHNLSLTENQVKILGIEILGLIRNNKLNFLKGIPRKEVK